MGLPTDNRVKEIYIGTKPVYEVRMKYQPVKINLLPLGYPTTTTTSTTTTTTTSATTPATAFIAAASITNPTQQSAITTLYNDLVSASLWTSMYAVWPLVGGTATAHQYNLVDVATRNLTFSGTIVHDASGMTTNGIDSHANTNVNLNGLSGQFGTGTMGIYTSTDGAKNYDMGSYTNGAQQYGIITKYSTNAAISLHASSGVTYPGIADARGLTAGTAGASTTALYKNGAQLATGSYTYQAATFRPPFIGALNAAGTATSFSDRTYSFAFIADEFTEAEHATLYTLIQNYQTTLSRQV